jgi:predicted ester cyclase
VSSENKELVRRYFDERWNKNNLEVIDELLAPSMSTDEARAVVAGLRAEFSDIHLTMEELIAEGDQVVVPFRVTGVHTGESMGVPPSGKPIDFRGFARLRVENGKIVHDEAVSNLLEVLLGKA